MKFFTNKIRYSILAGLAVYGTSILIVSMLVMTTTTVVPNVQAEDKDVLEELVDRYAEIAEKNVNAMKTRDNLQQKLDDELKKSIPDIAIIKDLQKAIDEQYVIMKNTAMELASIQAKVTEGLQMDPEFKQILKNARDILYENQEIIPWTGIGVSNSEQAVTISIDAENPEDYRMIIENLVGKDIPVVIKKGGNPFVKDTVIVSPLKQFKSGTAINEIRCKESLTLVTKHDGFPACVKPETKQYLIDREWAKTKNLDEIQENPDLIKQNIIRIEDGLISLYPANMCASLTLELPTEQDIQRYKNDEKGLDDTNTLQITSNDLKEIPDIQELIYAVHSIEFPYNKHSSPYLDGLTFVEYEFFLMEKAMKKYGDSQKDYFIKLDADYEERFTNPAKQGFTNHFIAPLIVYNENVYSIGGIHFWTSDEHNPRRMGVYPIDSIEDDEKFITLSDEDMKSIPKIKEAIENIGTVKESISAYKGLPEDQQNKYQEWFKQKSQDRLNADRFRLIQYDERLYSIGFGIC